MTINGALSGMHFGRRQLHLIGVVVARRRHARQDFAHLRFVVDELQQGLVTRPGTTDPEDVFGGRVEVDDQQVVVEQNDARAQGVEDVAGIVAEGSVTGTAALQRTVVCCT